MKIFSPILYYKHNCKKIKQTINIEPIKIIRATMHEFSIPFDLHVYPDFMVIETLFNRGELIEYTNIKPATDKQNEIVSAALHKNDWLHKTNDIDIKLLNISLSNKTFTFRIEELEDYTLILSLIRS